LETDRRVEANARQNEKDGESITNFMEDMVKHRQEIDTELEDNRLRIGELTEEIVEM
jgi:hypothetical protein